MPGTLPKDKVSKKWPVPLRQNGIRSCLFKSKLKYHGIKEQYSNTKISQEQKGTYILDQYLFKKTSLSQNIRSSKTKRNIFYIFRNNIN